MVSKLIKKLPMKAIKDRRSRHNRQRTTPRRKSPVKPATLMDSIKHRLKKFFSKLTLIGTPIGCATITSSAHRLSHKKKRYTALLDKTYPQKEEFKSLIDRPDITICRNLFESEKNWLLPPPVSTKGTVFLDLDETLIHSKLDPPPKRFDFVVRPKIDGELMTFYVLKRPGLDQFLDELTLAGFELVVFTAGLREYASLVIDRIDKKGQIAHRLYRDSCREVEGRFVKDLSETGRDLDKAVIVDDNPNSYSLQPLNAVPIQPFVSNMRDTELWSLIKFFKEDCEKFGDMRDGVKKFISSTSNSTEVVV